VPHRLSQRAGRTAVIGFVLIALLALAGTASGTTTPDEPTTAEYVVSGADTLAARNAVAAQGAVINAAEHGVLDVTATPREVDRLRALGYRVERRVTAAARVAPEPAGRPGDFPPQDSGYHNYPEMTAAIDRIMAEHPSLVSQRLIGQSYEGRDIVALKVSDHPGADEDEPEVLFTHQQHAREHLTVEMALYTLRMLTGSYGDDQRVTNLVDDREIWIVPTLNPDGSQYDIATGSYRAWRKNRQPNAGSRAVGTDLNRNWAYRWGCCHGSSGAPASDAYRGSAPESAPEVARVADFVRSRVVDGQQQITMAIDFHTYSELVLWPFGHTSKDTGPGMTAENAAVFQTLGKQLARTNGYTPMQASDLYVTDGTIDDWLWGDQGVYAFTFEMFPGAGGLSGFYPGDAVIDRETSRNREAVLRVLSYADCPQRVIGEGC